MEVKGLMGSVSKYTLTVFFVASWYATNIGILLLNKYLLSTTKFRKPVFLTTCHMLACTALGFILSTLGCFPLQRISSRKQLYKIFLLSTIFCATVTLGNASLRYIPVSFNQAIGATTPFFTALVAYLLQGTVERLDTYLSLVPVVVGIAIASGGEPSFHLFGFILCILSANGRALKSVVQGILMKDQVEKVDPMSLLFYMSVTSLALLIPSTMLLEPGAFSQAVQMTRNSPSFILWLSGCSVMAYLVNLLNFLVTKYTSALTLQVLGNAKGILAAAVSVAIFKNPVTSQGIFGYAVTLMGVFLYAHNKKTPTAPSSTAMVGASAAARSKSSGGRDESSPAPIDFAVGAANGGIEMKQRLLSNSEDEGGQGGARASAPRENASNLV